MLLVTFALTLFGPLLVSGLNIVAPDVNVYWVQGDTNTIVWNYGVNDPSPITIFITNPDDKTLHGPFGIAEFVPVQQQTVKVTDVTLKVGNGYIVNFVDPKNATNVYATSAPFEVKPHGTTPAAVPSGYITGNNTASSTSASGTATSTSTSATTGPTFDNPSPNGASALTSQWGAASTLLGALALGALTFAI